MAIYLAIVSAHVSCKADNQKAMPPACILHMKSLPQLKNKKIKKILIFCPTQGHIEHHIMNHYAPSLTSLLVRLSSSVLRLQKELEAVQRDWIEAGFRFPWLKSYFILFLS